jgi:hypothetical protein
MARKRSDLYIKELDIDMINPTTENYNDPEKGGSKLAVIGKPGTGKTFLIDSIIYKKSHIIPYAMVINGTESSNKHCRNIFPELFIYNELKKKYVEKFVNRQKIAIEHLANPWGLLLLDDCMDDPKLFNDKVFLNLYKNGRHYKMLFILSMQYCMDIKPAIREATDGTFILREVGLRARRKIYENYAGIIPTFEIFCELMDELTGDFTALYIHNQTDSNDWQDCVYYYKAKPVPKNFRFGSKWYKRFGKKRYNSEYVETY